MHPQLEAAALVYPVEHFEVHLLNNEFTVYTDHQALVSAFLVHPKSQTKGLLVRWYLRSARFLSKMRLEHKPVTVNAADALSRVPGGQLTEQETTEQDSVVLKHVELKVRDLVMLKVEPWLPLDRAFKDPFFHSPRLMQSL